MNWGGILLGAVSFAVIGAFHPLVIWAYDMEHAEGWRKLFCNVYFSTFVTLAFGFLLTQIGYANIWPLFGSANQLLSALVLATLCVFLKVTGRNNKMLFPPLVIMLCVTFTALVQRLIAMVKDIPGAKGAPSRAARSSSTSTVLLYPTAQILPNWQKSKNAPNTGIESPRYNSASNTPSGYNSCMVCPSGVPEYTPDRISFISTSSFKS